MERYTDSQKLDLLLVEFSNLNSRIDKLEFRFDKLESRFDNLETEMRERFATIENRLQEGLGAVHDRMDYLDRRMQAVELGSQRYEVQFSN